MKKYLIALIMFVGLGSFARAGIFDYGVDKQSYLKYDLSVAVTSTATVLIDLSDTTNWPHNDTGYVRIGGLRIDIDKAAASTTTVKLGVVNFINPSTGSITWFYEKSNLLNVSNTEIMPMEIFFPLSIGCKVSPNNGATDGDTPFIFSNDTTSGDTTYQTDVYLPSPNGNVYPGLGDIILYVSKPGASTSATVSVEIFYYTEKR